MVAVDDERRPVPVPSQPPTASNEHPRHAAAIVRRQMRKEMQPRFDGLRPGKPPAMRSS